MTIITAFRHMLEDPEEELRVDKLISSPLDKAVYEKWIQVFNSITPYSIPQGLSLIDSSFKMSKRDCVIFLAYIKFFEQQLNKMKETNSEMKDMFTEIASNEAPKGNEMDANAYIG